MLIWILLTQVGGDSCQFFQVPADQHQIHASFCQLGGVRSAYPICGAGHNWNQSKSHQLK